MNDARKLIINLRQAYKHTNAFNGDVVLLSRTAGGIMQYTKIKEKVVQNKTSNNSVSVKQKQKIISGNWLGKLAQTYFFLQSFVTVCLKGSCCVAMGDCVLSKQENQNTHIKLTHSKPKM